MKKNTAFDKNFKKWRKGQKLIFNEDMYTQLVNTNNKGTTLDEWFVEKVVFAILEDIKDFDLSTWNLQKIKTKEPISLLKQIFKEFGQEENFKNFWQYLKELIEYREEGIKNFDQEFIILNKYWNWTRYLYDRNVEGFNNWILIVNKYVYVKQKGYRLK
jgi:hypothetical protein